MNRTYAHKFYKTLVIVLLFSIALSLTACGTEESKNKTTKISADSPWYNAEIIDFKFETDPQKHLETLNHYLAGADEKHLAVYTIGEYIVKNDTTSIKYRDWLISVVTIIDRANGQTVKSVDLVDTLGEHDFPNNVNYSNGKIYTYVDSYDADTGISMNKEIEIDPFTEKILSSRDISIAQIYATGRSEYSYSIGKYRVLPEMINEENYTYYAIRIIEPDGSLTEVELKDSNESIFDVPVILALDETTALIPVAMAREYRFYKLDLKTNKLSKANKGEYSWIDVEQMHRFFNSPDGNVYLTTAEGISRIDMENKKYEQIFDFSWCGVNRNYTKRLRLADCSDDKILLCGSYFSMNMFESKFVENFIIVELTKASKNPHAGKTILELYMHDGEIDGTIANAIIRFNENNSKYYIQPTNRYDIQKYMSYDNLRNNDDYVSAVLKANSDISYELASDIANGVGPDILMNTSGLGQLNNDDCLVNLAPYIQELDSDKYFKNIIDGSKTDGKLYQLPVCYTIEGIQTDKSHAGKSGIGFTTEEYKKYLYDTLNGTDVIESGQVHYFAMLFNNMRDIFIKGGKVDLTGSEFAEIANYVKENVQQNSKMWNNGDDVDPNEVFDSSLAARNNKAYCCDCPGISGYLVKRARIKNGTAILGLPSSDGRGPMFGTKLSVAVSANALSKEACIEFVKMMLTDEIQKEFVLNDNFVLNKEALRQGCEDAIAYFNTEEGQDNMYEYSLGTYVSIRTKFTTEDIDNLENVILSCSKADSVDAAINMILIEEMPAYFAGQKTLEQVIPVMQNRIQKVLDERK